MIKEKKKKDVTFALVVELGVTTDQLPMSNIR
jgi:hypothetical protein